MNERNQNKNKTKTKSRHIQIDQIDRPPIRHQSGCHLNNDINEVINNTNDKQ